MGSEGGGRDRRRRVSLHNFPLASRARCTDGVFHSGRGESLPGRCAPCVPVVPAQPGPRSAAPAGAVAAPLRAGTRLLKPRAARQARSRREKMGRRPA